MFPSPRRSRARVALIAAILLFASSVVAVFAVNIRTPVTPAAPAAFYSAFSEVELCEGSGPCSVVEIALASDWHGQEGRVCITATTGPLVERGCAVVERGFGLDRDAIAWAEMPETQVTLAETQCNDRNLCQDIPTRSMTIAGIWSGEGETVRSERPSGAHASICGLPDISSGAIRTASLALTIDDQPVRAFGNIRVLHLADAPNPACAGFVP